ncbi:15532_t:CDS:2 [Gigaspora margarita]|uniref:15532_t:CDS:1 n=1 Tax=Gigaspora margarita TaxID=4874 RepID=A0ABN7UDG1_GIGMA|nr:15532_t:CDS:2 [Gigaspora margarita]
MFNFIAHHERFNELREVYLETICKYPLLLFDSEELPLLEEDALKLILKCDNLDIKECIDRKEIIPEVWNYKDILSNDLLKDILHCYLDLDVKPLHQQFWIRWGNFKMAHQKKFHQRWENKGATILVAIIQNSSLLVGGYNPLDWNGDTCPDLCVPNNSNIWKFKAKIYPKLVDPNSLTISDYEVFQVEQIQKSDFHL